MIRTTFLLVNEADFVSHVSTYIQVQRICPMSDDLILSC